MKKTKSIIFTLVALLIFTTSYSQENIFKRPEPPRLVNDFAKIFTANEINEIESRLDEFDKTNSTQIAVVTVNDLYGYDVNHLAFEIGQKWGVGQKGKNNGIVVLVKPKTGESNGYVAISVAYGLEDTLTDALSKRIIEVEMIPRFKQNDYFGGIGAAVNILIDITKGKYTAEQYSKSHNNSQKGSIVFLLISFFVIFIIALTGRNNRSNQHTIGRRGSDIPFWLLMGGMMGSRGSGNSDWGSFSSGSGSFGGFGGGSFGGGGASGRLVRKVLIATIILEYSSSLYFPEKYKINRINMVKFRFLMFKFPNLNFLEPVKTFNILKSFFLICILFYGKVLYSQQPDSSKLTIVFAGDIMGHTPQYLVAFDSTYGGYNYEPCFRFIKNYIHSFDIAFANLEVTLAGPPYSGYPQFSSPDELAFDIKNAGFNYLVTANNHCYDKKKKGFQRTIAILDSVGIHHLGTYTDSVQRNNSYPFIIEKKGIKIAVLNYTYGTNGLLTEKPNIVNYINLKTISADLAKADSLKADYKIVVMHWGKEYELKPNDEQHKLSNFLAKHGCNIIIGSHPHVVQTFELLYPDTTDSTHIVPVFYSMGNLISNQRNRYCDGGALFSFTIEKKEKAKATDFNYLPYWVYRGVLKNKYQYYVIPVKLFSCHSDSFMLQTEDVKHLREFESDTRKQLNNLKESDFFNCGSSFLSNY